MHGDSRGWRASGTGSQVIRLVFDEPIEISRIKVVFEEYEAPRTQEFLLGWTSANGTSGEIVRQQWNFSPPTTTREAEHFDVQLSVVSMIELTINPDIRGGAAQASLSRLRVA